MLPEIRDHITFNGSEHPEQMARDVAAWEAHNGPTTYVVFHFGPGLVPGKPEGGRVAVLREQRVLPCVADAPTSRNWDAGDLGALRRADELAWFGWAYVPLGMVTGHSTDRALIKMRKRAATRLQVVHKGVGDA